MGIANIWCCQKCFKQNVWVPESIILDVFENERIVIHTIFCISGKSQIPGTAKNASSRMHGFQNQLLLAVDKIIAKKYTFDLGCIYGNYKNIVQWK